MAPSASRRKNSSRPISIEPLEIRQLLAAQVIAPIAPLLASRTNPQSNTINLADQFKNLMPMIMKNLKPAIVQGRSAAVSVASALSRIAGSLQFQFSGRMRSSGALWPIV